MAISRVPSFRYPVPSLDHDKKVPYLDYPLVYNETVAARPFYAEYDFTFVTSDLANTTLYKWSGGGWVQVAGIAAVDLIYSRGFFAVTTAANAYVAITEHVN